MNGKMIKQIRIGKTSMWTRVHELEYQIWTCSADHHTGQRLLKRRNQRPDRRPHSITRSSDQKLLASRAATTEASFTAACCLSVGIDERRCDVKTLSRAVSSSASSSSWAGDPSCLHNVDHALIRRAATIRDIQCLLAKAVNLIADLIGIPTVIRGVPFIGPADLKYAERRLRKRVDQRR